MILSDALILPVSQLKHVASDDVTNYVTHRIFIQTYYILALIL